MSLSEQLFSDARAHIPGGVNSPVRAFHGVGGTPVFFARGEGPYLFDTAGKRYVDYIGSWGPMILGHAYPPVLEAVREQMTHGLGFGAPTLIETEMANLLCQLLPSLDQVRMVNSGTEATMSAIRLARGFTGRERIIKFEGCYHGHADSLLVKAGSGALTLGIPGSPGVPAATAALTHTARFNDLSSVTELCDAYGAEIAAIIVEPVAGNMNCIPPQPGFLQGLREICDHHGIVLIFDEVMSGFRVGLGGAQGVYQVTPDLTTLGKVIGGGLPVGAFGGRREIMDQLAPEGPVYQAGTLSGNPIALSAGLATLKAISAPGFFDRLDAATRQILTGLHQRASAANVPFQSHQIGGMFGIFFTDQENITRYDQVTGCDLPAFRKFFHAMLAEGVYLAPSAFEAGFVSSAHDDKAISLTLDAAEKSFQI